MNGFWTYNINVSNRNNPIAKFNRIDSIAKFSHIDHIAMFNHIDPISNEIKNIKNIKKFEIKGSNLIV
jgi:hypothetical protein